MTKRPQKEGPNSLKDYRARVSTIIEIGNDGDFISRSYDFVSVLAIVVNLVISLALTFDSVEQAAGPLLGGIESVTYLFFAVDFILRLGTAGSRYPDLSEGKAAFKYLISFMGIVDLLSFLPYYLPVFFPAGAVAFRMFRVVRIFRLFRINVYYDSLNVIAEVIGSKRQQLLSSVFIILTLMVASSLCMYSLEHEAQPEVFQNAFSGIWWSVSTLLTVGYGDIYPITTLGKVFSILITFLGVGMVAIPTGIISAGFVDQYSRVKQISDYGKEDDMHFVKVRLKGGDEWSGRKIGELELPQDLVAAAVRRRKQLLLPDPQLKLEDKDVLILGAGAFRDDVRIQLKEVTLKGRNPWIGEYVGDLDISRKTLVVMVRREGRILKPAKDLVLKQNDAVILYTERHLPDAEHLEV